MKNKRPGPVSHGNGGGVPIDQQARHYTLDALRKLQELLNAQTDVETFTNGQKTTTQRADALLQFWVARYLIELGHGRNALRKAGEGADPLSDDDEQKMKRFMEKYERSKHDGGTAPDTVGDVLGDGVSRGMAGDGAAGPADPGR